MAMTAARPVRGAATATVTAARGLHEALSP